MYTLGFDLRTQGADALKQIDAIVANLQKSTSATSAQLSIFAQQMKFGIDNGKSLEATLRALSSSTAKVDSTTRNYARGLVDQANSQKKAEDAAKAHAREIDNQEKAYRRLAAAQDAANKENAKRSAAPPGLLDGFGKGFGSSALGLGVVGGIGLQLGRAAFDAISGSVRALTSDFGKYAQAVVNASDRTGLTTREFQQFSGAASIAGVNAGALTTAMRTLSRGLAEGEDEGKKQAAVLRKMGVDAAEASGKIRPVGDIILDVYKKLGDIPAGAQRDFFAQTIFGRGGLETLPLAGRLDELSAAVKRSGAVISDQGIKTGQQYAEQLARIGLAWDGLVHRLAVPIVGTINLLLDAGNPQIQTATGAQAAAFGRRGRAGTIGASDPRGTQGLFDQAIFGANSLVSSSSTQSANKAAYDRFVKGNLREQLSLAEGDLAATPRPNASTGQAGIDAYNAAQANVERLRKAISEAGSDAKRSAAEIREFDQAVRSLSGAGESKLLTLQNRYQDTVERLSGTGKLTSAQRATLYGAYSQGASNEIADSAAQVRKSLATKSLEKEKKDVEGALTFLEFQNSEDIRARTEATRNSDRQTKEEDTQKISGIRDNASRRARLLGVNTQPGQELSQLSQERSIRREAIDQERQILESHSGIYDIDAKRYELQKQANDADLEYLEQAARLAKEREQSFASTFATGASAILRGQGRGFIQSVGNQLENTVLTNAGKLIYESPQFKGIASSLHIGGDPNSTFGRLLAGTPFGPKDGQSSAVSINTQATIDNTAATGALTNLIGATTGTPVNGVAGAGSIGTPGSLSFPGFGSGTVAGGILGGIGAASSLPGLGGIPGLGSLSGILKAGFPISSTQSYSGFSGFAGGLAHTGDLQGIFTGVGSNAESLSTSERFGAGIGSIGAAAGGTLSAISGFKRGGGRGITQGIGSIAGTAALFDPEPISKAVLAGVALVSGVISGIFGDPKQNRENAISKYIAQNRYLAPESLNVRQGPGGTFEDFDARGNIRTSSLRALPTVAQPYIAYHGFNGTSGGTPYYDVPGYQSAPFSGSPSGSGQAPVTNVTIMALDAQSFADFAQKNHAALGNAVATHLQIHEGRLSNAIRNVV